MSLERAAVSALIPIKNGAQYVEGLRLQLDRTLSTNDEILIIDDFSSDGTWECLKTWSRADQRLRFFKNEKPGIANALNLGLANASNDWIARYDADDQYRIDRIAQQLNQVDSNTVAVFSDYNFITPAGKNLGYIPTAITPAAVSVSLIASQRTPHPVALINRDAVLSAGGYRQSDFPAEDLSLWLRISRLGDLKSVPEPLLSYVINPNGVSSNRRTLQLDTKNRLIQEIGIRSQDLELVTDQFENIIGMYKKEEYSGLRTLLLSRELRLAGLSAGVGKHQINSITNSNINLKDFRQIVFFALQTLRRRLIRRLN